MKYKKLQLLTILLLMFGLTNIQAQTMHIKESSGMQTAQTLSDVQKIIFFEENIIVEKINNSSEIYAVSDLRYLSFKDYATNITEQPRSLINFTLITYPNPVKEVLNIDLTGNECGGTLCIFTLESELVYTEQNNGSTVMTLNLSQLPQGIYICQYITTTEVKSSKIIKK